MRLEERGHVVSEYRELYWLENYLFSHISPRFAATKTLSAFDFFCIVVWKANRAKSKVARRLLEAGFPDLSSAVAALAHDIGEAPDPKERLRVLLGRWGFRLPMASAILTVLYPDEFTVFDVRVCESLGDDGSLSHRINFESVWSGYVAFIDRVRNAAPQGLSLRDQDRWLWGKSFVEQLSADITASFAKTRTHVQIDA